MLRVPPDVRLGLGYSYVEKKVGQILLGTAVLAAVTLGVVTYQTDMTGAPTALPGPGVDRHVLAEPCIHIYLTGIVRGSLLMILLIPVAAKKGIITLSEGHRIPLD